MTALGALALAGLMACGHEVVRLTELPPLAPITPIPLTVAVAVGSFERSRVNADGVTALFAKELREAGLFQGVMYPVPAGARPRWEIELAGSDSAIEPNSNRWKSMLTTVLPPLGFFLTFENDYSLQLEALLLDEREIVESYVGEATIRHRYQDRANRVEMDLEGVEVAVHAATRGILASLADDATRLGQLNQRVR